MNKKQVDQPTGDLTDEQIDALMNKSGIMNQRWPTEKQYRQFARAAIAAHLASQSQAAQPSESREILTAVTSTDRYQEIARRIRAAAENKWNDVFTIEMAELIEYVAHLAGQSQATKVQAVPDIDAMVNRFLGWPLPKDFSPDCGISFDGRKDDEWNKNKTWPTGTNLLAAEQAKAMFAYCLNGQTPPNDEWKRRALEAESNLAGALRALGAENGATFMGEPAASRAPTAQEVTQQAAKAETAEQDAREMAIAQAVRRACVDCYSPDDLAADWSEKMGDLNLSSIIKSVAPTTSTVSAPDEIRNAALEEGLEMAARHLDKQRQAVDQDHAYQESDTGAWVFDRPETEEYSNTLAELADEIRALKRTNPATPASTDTGSAA